jgi:hypothetical protein
MYAVNARQNADVAEALMHGSVDRDVIATIAL